MGFGGFRTVLTKHLPKCIKTSKPKISCDYLFLEGNTILHRAKNSKEQQNHEKLVNFDDESEGKYTFDEEKTIKTFIRSLKSTVTKFEPISSTTLVFDGCSPFAKMHTQYLSRCEVCNCTRLKKNIFLEYESI